MVRITKQAMELYSPKKVEGLFRKVEGICSRYL